MDTSEQRIKMCEKATEIQEQWEPSAWDYVFCKREQRVVILSGYCVDGGYYGHGVPSKKGEERFDYYTGSCDDLSQNNFKEMHVWLPNPVQLQKIMEIEDTEDLFRYMEQFAFAYADSSGLTCPDWLDHCGKSSGWPRPSGRRVPVEQFWLAFAERQLYNRVWNGEDWV